jgi:hypothetical protein
MQGITDDMYCTCPCSFRKSAKLITGRCDVVAVLKMFVWHYGYLAFWSPPWLFVCLGGLRMASTGHNLFPASFQDAVLTALVLEHLGAWEDPMDASSIASRVESI